jgi:Outer membrane protein beta-barrel domain
MMKAGFLSFALCAAFASNAQAQMTWTDKAVVNVTGGAQAGSHTVATSATFDLYDEQGTLGSSQKVGGGGLFDVSGGYKVRKNLVAGIGYSWSGSKADAAITALVPDPAFTDQPRTVSATAAGMKHTENTIHLFAAYMVPVTDKIDVGISAGPSIFMVSQDLPTALTVTEPGPTVNQVTTEKSSKTTAGVNIGLDVTYLMSKRWGIGGLMRYTWGSVDLKNATDKLTVGGFQIGAGVRLRFQSVLGRK